MTALDLLARLDPICDRVGEVLRTTSGLAARATSLAGLLADLCPGALLCACLLQSDGQSSLAVQGEDAPGWQARLAPGDTPDKDVPTRWLSQLGRDGRTAIVRPVGDGHGTTALVLTGDADATPAGVALSAFARSLALRLDGEGLREDLLEQERLANVGELGGAVSHEFTNFLNVLLLHVSVLEYQLPQAHIADLAEIRRQGNLATEVVRQFQQYRQGQAPPPRSLDLNAAVREVAEECVRESPAPLLVRLTSGPGADESIPLALELGGNLPPVRGVRPHLLRLIRFVLANALRAAAQTGGSVWVRTDARNRLRLEVHDSGTSVSADHLAYFFDPSKPAREGVEALELAACKSLARRVGGTIAAENRPEGGVMVAVEFAKDPR